MDLIVKYANTISFWSIFIPLAVGLYYYRTFGHLPKVLFFYIVFGTIMEFVIKYHSNRSINNLYLFHIFTLVEFFGFVFIFFQLLDLKEARSLLLVTYLAFATIAVTDFFFISGYKNMNVLAKNIQALVLISLAIAYFLRSLKTLSSSSSSSPTQTFSFWYSTAIIVYLSGSFFLFLFSNYMMRTSPENYNAFYAIFTIHSAFNTIFNVLIAVSFTKKAI